jgi:hypothetical protein
VRPGPSPGGAFRIDRDGGWRHDGVEVTHPGVLRNLFENLRADGDTHYLAVGPARIPVSVDDAPFVVVRIEADPGTAAVRAHLSDGSVEPLAIESLDVDAQAVPRCRVKGGRFRARLSVAAWLQLTALAEAALESGEPVLRLGERSVPLGGHP